MTYVLESWDDTPRDVRDRTGPVKYIIIHGTGSGVTERALKARPVKDPNTEAAEYYDTPHAHAPHYLVTWRPDYDYDAGIPRFMDTEADVYQIAASDDERMPHAGIDGAKTKIYRKRSWPRYYKKDREWIKTDKKLSRYDWWFERWRGLAKNPAAVIPGGDNGKSVGIEVLVPVRGKKRGGYTRIAFTERQHDVAAWLCAKLFHKHNLPYDAAELRIVGHADVNPIGRTARKGPYDPGHGKWWDWGLFFSCFSTWFHKLAYQEPDKGLGRHS